jgi:uncharacterized membrane protein
MNQRYIGITLIIVAILIGVFVGVTKANHAKLIWELAGETGSCFNEEGTCLHEQNNTLFVVGWSLSGALLLFGVYLAIFDKTQRVIAEHQVKVSSALESAMKEDKKKSQVDAYLAGFSDDEQNVLKVVFEQQGIQQSTLRFRTGLSKTSLSLILRDLEERNVISRKDSGKTKQVFTIKKF